MNLTRTNWSAGWIPSADAVNGDPNGLVRMDNLCLDSQGVVSLIEGQNQIGPNFSDYPSDIFSRVINGFIYFWISLNVNATSVFRTDQSFSGQLSMVVAGAGANTARACFGDCLGNVLAIAGKMRTKDDVTGVGPLPLGLLTPIPSGVNSNGFAYGNSQPKLALFLIFTGQEGTVVSFNEATVDPTTLEGIVVTNNITGVDTTFISGGSAANISRDLIQFNFSIEDNIALVTNTLIVQILLDGNPTDPTTYQNYYAYEVDTSTINPGVATSTQISIQRGDFTRVGSDSTLNWTNVNGIRFVVQTTAACTYQISNFQFVGGATGQLNGVYNYVQVNVRNNGKYVAMSPASTPLISFPVPSIDVNVINGSVTILPCTVNDPQVNEMWFFRIAATDVGLTSTGSSGNSSFLSQYYFCTKIIGTSGLVTDTLSDDTIIEIGITLNQFLQTMRTDDAVNGLQDEIRCIEGLYFERMIYMGKSFIYLSDNLNPDAVDQRYTLRPSGDSNEVNLWIKKIVQGAMILATTKDLYELTGTLNALPDGTIDAVLTPIGDAFPPLSQDCAAANGGIFYIAADGLRFTTGQHSQNVSSQLQYLFQGQIRHGVPPILLLSGNQARYAITQGHNRIYFTCPLNDGTIRLFVYDLAKQTFFLRYTDPVVLHTTQNGYVIAGYNIAANGAIGSNTLWTLDSGGGGFNGTTGFPITLYTVFDANGQPRNRKDTFTLKLILDTGGRQVSIYLQKDGIGVFPSDDAIWVFLQNVSTSGLTTVYIPLNADNITLGFRYALKIVDVNTLFVFKLYEYTIEYDPRPEQLDWMRIQPSNLGTISRKRFVNYAFVIDTLGNNITFTPLIDNSNGGVAPSTSTVNTAVKQTFIHYFTQEQIGTDISGILSGGVFEFYSLNEQEIVSEKLPVPVKYLVIPADNYGTPNRKRHTSYKFQCLTRGATVSFIPVLDGVSYKPLIFSTSTKRIVEYFFDTTLGDIIGIDIGGILQSTADTPFEFYGVITPQQIEVLPPRLEFFRIPNSNFGIAARKRIRTIPIIIDTYGQNVTFTPIVDGIPQANTTTLNSNGKTTLYHYFINDVFGTDFGGTLSDSVQPFEFYELGTPEDVETLPVPKKYDQLGPVRFDRIGKLFTMRIRLIVNGTTTSIPFTVYGDNNPTNPTYGGVPLFNDSLVVIPGTDNVYEYQFPKSINTTMCRITLGPIGDSFHRYDMQLRVSQSGMETDATWQPIR